MQPTALGWSSLNPFSQSLLRGMFLFIQLTHLHLLLCYFSSEELAKQFFPAASTGRVQPSTRPCWDSSPAQWNESLQHPLFPSSLLPVHRDICETQKDKSSSINCQPSADTSCHTIDRTEFIKINLNNEELRILLNSKRSICSAGEVLWKSPSMGISPWFPSVGTITFIMIKTCLD